MQAMILAAGMGKRLGELTKNCTKSMVRVNGITLMERMLDQLDKLSLSKIIIVIGFEGEKLKSFIEELGVQTKIEFIENPIYYKTNNIYSLFLGREHLMKEDTILLESDLIFEEGLLKKLVDETEGSLVLVDKFKSWMDGTCVTLDGENKIRRFVSKREFDYTEINEYYKTVNIYRFKKEFSEFHYVPFLEAYCKALGNNEYYEQVLKVVTLLDSPGIKALSLTGEKWYEIDDVADLDVAESMFSEGKEMAEKIHRRYGGYWRYPNLVDFCYLVNPLFPPKKLLEEIKSVLPELIMNYPSGAKVMNLLGGKNIDIPSDFICMGNGVAELIKALMPELKSPVGVVIPSFEEYINQLDEATVIAFPVGSFNEEYRYSEEDLIHYFGNKDIKSLVIVNPENPSGNFIGKKGMEKLLVWTKENNIRLVLDESFIDFSDFGEMDTCLDKGLLEENCQLILLKSISKAHGVPGIRLGFAATGDGEMLKAISERLPIWNINSFAEFYLQIFGKYEKDFQEALKSFRLLRTELEMQLKGISFLEVMPTQANFFMCKVKTPYTASSLTEKLLSEHNLLIKNLTGKKGLTGEWIRIAVKTKTENEKMMQVLQGL